MTNRCHPPRQRRYNIVIACLLALMLAGCAGRAMPPDPKLTTAVTERMADKAMSAGTKLLLGLATGKLPNASAEGALAETYRTTDAAFTEEGYSLDRTLLEFLKGSKDATYYRNAMTSGLAPLLAAPLTALRNEQARETLRKEGRVSSQTLDLFANHEKNKNAQ